MAFPHRFGIAHLQAPQYVSVPYPPLPVVPVVTATHYIVPTIANPVIASGPRLNKKKDPVAEKAPSTTVFVGNIHEKANNEIMRNLLFKCGNIVQWKRVYGSNGKFQAFGFCEFDHPDATLRAIRFLNNLNLGGKRLLIKCDEKTQVIIKEYINKRRVQCGKPVLTSEKIEDIPIEEYAWNKDEATFKLELRQVIEAANEPGLLLQELPNEASSRFESNATLTSQLILPETEGADKDKLGLIEREIKQFRSTHKDHRVKGRPRSPRSPDDHHSSKSQSLDAVGLAAKPTDSTVPDEQQNKQRRSPSRKPTATTQSQDDAPAKTAAANAAASPVSSRASSQARHLSNSRNNHKISRRSRSRESPRPVKRRSRSRSRSRRRDSEDDGDIADRMRLERKIREKELAYQQRLKKWESRERKKRREYEKEKHNEKQKRKEELREAKKLKEFFEDYDDEVEDPKYYKGKSYEMRRRDYERELEADTRDRQKEKEELDEIRRKLLSEGVEDPDVEIMRIQKEQEERLLKRLRADSTGSESPLVSTVASSPKMRRPSSQVAARASTSDASDDDDTGSRKKHNSTMNNNDAGKTEIVIKPWKSLENSEPVDDDELLNKTPGSEIATPGQTVASTSAEQQPVAKGASFGFAGLKLTGRGASATAPLASANNADPDDDGDLSASKRQRPLVKLEYSEEENRALDADAPPNAANMTVDEKRKAIKSLIEKIPTNKDELFAYAINWPTVDKILIEKRLKPWVNKKIVEYIGEEEPSLVEFICQKVVEKCPPQSILEDISMVLDEEASVFVIKLWRLLIYEIEAKRYGLVKLD